MKEKNRLSMSLEDYLEQIYILQETGKAARVTDIALELNLSKPSVNRAMSTLKEYGYLNHEHYGTIELTEKGRKAAENIYETHKIVKKFLIEFLGVEEDTAEQESCEMSHAISKGTRKRLKKYMKKSMKEK